MAQSEGGNNPNAYFATFKTSLTRQQQKFLTSLLPNQYSFQPYKSTRSLDEESLKSEPMKAGKKKQNREQKDPDYSASFVAGPKEPPAPKIESSQVIPGGQPFLECYLILKKLKKSISAWPFKVPVDPKALGIPQYLNVVLEPVDLKTMEDNLRKENYKHPGQFHRDIYKMLMNSYKFNQKNSEVFATTIDFEEEYLKIVKEAKEGKLIFQQQKKAKSEGMQDEQFQTFINKQKQSSIEPPHKPRTYTKKKDSIEKNEQIVKVEKDKEKVKQKEHEKEKIKIVHQPEIKQKEQPKIKEKKEEPPNPPSYIPFYEDLKSKNDDAGDLSDLYEPTNFKDKIFFKQDREQASISNEPSKKNKEKHSDSKARQKKTKQKIDMTESAKQIKEMKEVTQVENQKNLALLIIQKKLAQLLKRMGQFQLPKPKPKPLAKAQDQYQHPNLNNFSAVTASQKKKLAERISLLPSTELKYILEICFRNKRDKRRDEEGVYELDLQKTDPKILKELSNFVAMRSKLLKKVPRPKNQGKMSQSQAQAAQSRIAEQQINHFGYEQQDSLQQQALRYYQPDRNPLGDELILQHPADDIHSYILDAQPQYSQRQLMEIDYNGGIHDSMADDDFHHF